MQPNSLHVNKFDSIKLKTTDNIKYFKILFKDFMKQILL